LRGLQLTIEPGDKVALVGESGCGKSTFINLLMRFYDVDFGEVLLDDVNIKEYNLHDLRKCISLVMQEPIIFNYSILENVLYGKMDATNTEILESTNLANATEFIEGNNAFKLDEGALSLQTEMEKNKNMIVEMIGV
jgi:ABC-type multidrug transport system fused ATPase/permease subunit